MNNHICRFYDEAHVVIDGCVRTKRLFRATRIRKATLDHMVAKDVIVIIDGNIIVTSHGVAIIRKCRFGSNPDMSRRSVREALTYREKRERRRTTYREMIDRGYVRRQVWVKEGEQLEKFDAFMKEEITE